MNMPLPYPWQVDEHNPIFLEDYLYVYDDAKARVIEADKAGQDGVKEAWRRKQLEYAEKIIEFVREYILDEASSRKNVNEPD